MCKTGKNKNWYLPSPGRFTGTSGAGAKRRGACADARLLLAARTGARATPANHSPTRGRGAEALRRLNCDCFFCRKVCLARFSVFLSGGCIMEISRSPFPRPPHACRVGGGMVVERDRIAILAGEDAHRSLRVLEIVEISILLRYYTLIPGWLSCITY